MSQLYSYEMLRDSINESLEKMESRLDDLNKNEMISLIRDLISERKLIIEEIDELRESRYGWINQANNRIKSMKLILNRLDEGAYNNLQSKASRLGIEDGRLLNELMLQALTKSHNGDFPQLSANDLAYLRRGEGHVTIEHLKELVVSRIDLEESKYRVKFAHINNLKFEADIDSEIFYNKVKEISHCRRVSFSKIISKLLVYAKAGFCREYEFI